jgi:hypothetical protein
MTTEHPKPETRNPPRSHRPCQTFFFVPFVSFVVQLAFP